MLLLPANASLPNLGPKPSDAALMMVNISSGSWEDRPWPSKAMVDEFLASAKASPVFDQAVKVLALTCACERVRWLVEGGRLLDGPTSHARELREASCFHTP